MDIEDTNHWTPAERRSSAEAGYRSPRQPYQDPRDYPPARQPYQDPRDYPPAQASRQVSLRLPATPPVSLQPTTHVREQRGRPYLIRRPRTWPQRVGGMLIAGACVLSAAWYVPRVMSDDHRLLTGTVTSTGVIALNFTGSGEINKVNVHLDQQVRKGEVLADEYAPNAGSIVAADKATVTAEQAKMAELRAAEAADPAAAAADNAQLAVDRAQLAVYRAQLATDRMKVAATEIVAPSSGIIVAANGQPGETVTSSGIRDYVTGSQQAPATQRPAFSLLPEGPQSVREASASGSSLPVIALRISTTWQVVVLIPEDSVSAIRSEEKVTISVPAARIKDVPGQVEEVLSTPIPTSEGVFYQAVVIITGHAANLPLNGMAADVQLGS
ncbi:MAG: hypothetical protein ACRDNT_03930 [Streptosporangiaceae bacterium]